METGVLKVKESVSINRFVLLNDEVAAIRKLLSKITAQYQTVQDDDFLEKTALYSHELPWRLRTVLTRARAAETPTVMIISGYPIDDVRIGPTPEDLSKRSASSSTLEEETLFILMASLLGDVIGWKTQQNGRLVHDVFPIKSHAHEQIGTGSEQPIWWHTEDAFHELRGDYVGLMCLRNPDQIATTVCPMDEVHLSREQVELLSQPRFTIRPDESHLRKNAAEAGMQGDSGFERIEEMQRNPQRVAVLSGSSDAPYIRIDPYFMDAAEGANAQRAFDELVKEIDGNLQELVLEPGDICFIDNYRAVHGRKPFKAKYNGRDRWLKRINITRDLRKSRAFRESGQSRVIF